MTSHEMYQITKDHKFHLPVGVIETPITAGEAPSVHDVALSEASHTDSTELGLAPHELGKKVHVIESELASHGIAKVLSHRTQHREFSPGLAH